MRFFRLGYVLTFSFLLILMVVTLTFGYYSAPTGPKSPEYPAYSSSSSYNSPAYQQQQDKYKKDQKDYKDQQKNFMQDKVVPYARNVFVTWIIILVTFQIIGLVVSRFASSLVGSAFAFSGFWAVIFGPLGSLVWFSYSLVSSFGYKAEETFKIEPLLQALGLTCLVGVVVLGILGIFFYGKVRQIVIPGSVSYPPTPPSPPQV